LGDLYAAPLKRAISYFVGVPEDEALVKDFLVNEYFRQAAVNRTLQCQKEDGAELITRFRPEVLKQGTVVLAVDRGKVCGLAINRFVAVDHSAPRQTEAAPADWGEKIDQQKLRHLGTRTIRTICAWMDELTVQMLPDECKEYFLLDILGVKPTYRG
jgi:hypothetical protein